MVVVSLAIAVWIVLTTFKAISARVANKPNKIQALFKLPREFVGMVMAHAGMGIFIIGVTATSTFSVEKDVGLQPGESYELGDYRFEFLGVSRVPGPNYQADQGEVRVFDDGELLAVLRPEKRFYPIQEQPMTEAAIDPGFFRDVYVALGDELETALGRFAYTSNRSFVGYGLGHC